MIDKIKNYINYLCDVHGLYISLHPIAEENIIQTSELRVFNIHTHSYCIFIKKDCCLKESCINCQKEIFKLCKNNRFFYECFAGQGQYVYPIKRKECTIGFISVSGYTGNKDTSFRKKFSENIGVAFNKLEKQYSALKNTKKPDFLDTVIVPLQIMLQLALETKRANKAYGSLYDNAVKFISENYRYNIKSNDICSALSCSRSVLSHTFKQNSGMSVREFINSLRIHDAELLLKNSRLSITDISFSVGFNDSNYFSQVFYKKTGFSPRTYRKINK